MQNIEKDLILLQSTTDPIERNRLALKLTAEHPTQVEDVLVRMIQQPELKDARGTLVHCLAQINPPVHFTLFIDLLLYGGWEAAHEALDALSSIEELDSPDVSIAIQRLNGALAADIEEWRRELIDNVLGAMTE